MNGRGAPRVQTSGAPPQLGRHPGNEKQLFCLSVLDRLHETAAASAHHD